MDEQSGNIVLPQASVGDLRQRWEQAHGTPPPAGLGRDLLARAIAFKAQEKAAGPLPRPVATQLGRLARQLATSGELGLERQMALKPGTRLVRDWHGHTYQVTVLKDGFVLDEQRYSSLSQVARAITGVKWSGPRFFGLAKPERRGRTSTHG